MSSNTKKADSPSEKRRRTSKKRRRTDQKGNVALQKKGAPKTATRKNSVERFKKQDNATSVYDRRETTLLSTFDENPLSVLEVAPAGSFAHPSKVRAVVQFAHGMQEHKERYEDFMAFLAQHGIASIINDHRGHGKSVRSKRNLGFFGDNTGRAIVQDTRQIQIQAVSTYPNVPLILFGHSMGSLVVRSFLKKYDQALSGLVVCGPPAANPAAGLGLYLVRALSALKGSHAQSKFMERMAFGNVNNGLEGTHPLRWLSASQENVRAYEADEYCGFAFSLNGYQNLLALLHDAYSKEGWALANPQLPILFIAGAADPIVQGEQNWQAQQEFLRARGYADVSGKRYAGMRHEILNEEEKTIVYYDVLAFIEQVIAQSA